MDIYKYHSCENSFLILEHLENIDYSFISKKLCEEHKTDWMLILKKEPLEMLVINKDGSEAKMCGNGIRCLVNYLYDKHYITKNTSIKTKAGIFDCEVIESKPFISTVNLGNGEYISDICYSVNSYGIGSIGFLNGSVFRMNFNSGEIDKISLNDGYYIGNEIFGYG